MLAITDGHVLGRLTDPKTYRLREAYDALAESDRGALGHLLGQAETGTLTMLTGGTVERRREVVVLARALADRMGLDPTCLYYESERRTTIGHHALHVHLDD